MEIGKKKSQDTQKCLQLFKGYSGPVTCIEELHEILKTNPAII